MQNDGRRDVSICDFVGLDDRAEVLQVERGHNNSGKSGVGGKMDEALKSWAKLVCDARRNYKMDFAP